MIELRTELEKCLDGYSLVDSDYLLHDALAAHAYQQAVDQLRKLFKDSPKDSSDKIAAMLCEELNTRAAEILADWMKGE